MQRVHYGAQRREQMNMPFRHTTIAVGLGLGLGLLVLVGSAARAQGRIEPGAVIRAHFAANRFAVAGTLVSRTPDSLTLAPPGGGLVQLPRASVTALDLHDGRGRLLPAAKWAFWGAAIWGGVAAIVPYRACDPTRYSNCATVPSKSEFVVSQAAGMAIITGIIGAVRGEDRWVQVERVTP